MGMVVWVMMGIAVWHFGFIVNGGTVPGQDDTHLIQAVIAIPGALMGLALSYLWGARLDREHGVDHGHTREGAH
jgi:hypothetical protein